MIIIEGEVRWTILTFVTDMQTMSQFYHSLLDVTNQSIRFLAKRIFPMTNQLDFEDKKNHKYFVFEYFGKKSRYLLIYI
jgi:hypothetical protein